MLQVAGDNETGAKQLVIPADAEATPKRAGAIQIQYQLAAQDP
jgi:hypothetical protein